MHDATDLAGPHYDHAQLALSACRRPRLGGIEWLIIAAVVCCLQADRAGIFERLPDKLVRLGEIAGAQQRQTGVVGDIPRGVQ